MALSTLTVDLQISLAKFETDLKNAVAQSKRSTDLIAGTFEGLRDALATFGVGFGLVEFLKEVASKAVEVERSQNQLAATLKATGYAAGLTTDELEKLGSALQHSTAFDDEDIRNAEVALLRFRDIQGDVYKDALKATLDLATIQRGPAADAARIIGKALEDPAASLRQLKLYGIELTTSQKDLIRAFQEAGNAAGAQRVLLDALAKSFGGLSTGENQGLYGASRATAKAYDELLKAIGRTREFQSIAQGALGGLTQILRDFSEQSDHGLRNFRGFVAEVLSGATKIGGVTALFAAAAAAIVAPGAEGKRSQAVTGTVGGGPKDLEEHAARLGDLQHKIDVATEAADVKAFQRLQARAAATAAGMQKILQIEQLGAAEQQSLLQSSYDRGLVSIQQYYDAQNAIAQHSADVKLKAIAVAVKAQEDLLKSPSTTPQARPAIEGEIGRLKAQADLVREQTAVVARRSADRQIDTEQAYRDSIAQTTAALLEQQGHYEAAARLRIQTEERVRDLQLGSNRSTAAKDELDRVNAGIIAQGALNDRTREYNTLREEEATRELDIQTRLAQAGADPQNQLNALAAINAARLASLPALERVTQLAIEQAKALGNPETVANLERQAAELRNVRAQSSGAAAAAQAFQIAQQRAGLLFRQEATEEQRVQNLRTAGALSALDTEILLDRARENSIANLTKEADALEVIARQTKDPEMLQRVEEMRVAIEGLAAAAHSAANIFQGIFQDAFSNAFVDFLQGTRTATAAFQDFVKSVIRGLEQIAAQQLAQAIFGSIFSAAGGAVGKGFTNLFGTGAGTGGSVAFSNRMALGGITSGPTLAGEVPGQREAVIPLSGNRFVPVKLLDSGSGKSGDVNVQVNVTGTSASVAGAGNNRDAEQLGRVIAAAVQSEMIRQRRAGGILQGA